jgi:multidrug efflux pump subunit AcrA (membrane-fusion protein)
MKKAILCLLLLVVLTGCFVLPVEEAVPAFILGDIPDPRPIRTATVERGDVVLFSNPSAVYIPAREQTLTFGVSGYRVLGINVKAGDEVKTGDIIATLARPYIYDQIEELLWEEKWARLDLIQSEERHLLLLSHAGLSGVPVDDISFLNERRRMENRLDIIKMRLDYAYNELERTYLRVPFDGTITQVLELSGTVFSNPDQTIATLSAHERGLFRLTGVDAADMAVGEQYPLFIGGEGFTGLVVNPADYDIRQGDSTLPEAFLTVTDGQPVTDGPVFATVHIVKAQANDVLFVPNITIRRVQNRVFVYVLENGLRTAREIGVGLVGNTVSEVLWGLEEGDRVVHE